MLDRVTVRVPLLAAALLLGLPATSHAAVDAGAVRRILGEALGSDDAYDLLADLCDRVGNRLSGSPGLDKALGWAEEHMRAAGLAHVHREPVMVPVWVRGEERAAIVTPVARPLSILGLGGSVGTPAGGVTADAIVVGSFEELEALGEKGVKGRIVVFDVPFTNYGETVKYRGLGASTAAKLGAVAVLVRSVGPMSYDTPHTGALFYKPDAPQIPAAALTIEDATALRRMARRGDALRLHLEMGAKTLADAPSANVVGEVVGREHPEEIVLLGAHLDSWDVGQGAQDDGVGVTIVTEAAAVIHKLGLRPRRTIRVVLFTNEENGLRGGKAYRDTHQKELGHHVAVLESDAGNGLVRGFSVDARPKGGTPWSRGAEPPPAPDAAAQAKAKAVADEALARVAKLASWLEPLEATNLHPGHAGADLEPMLADGVFGMGLDHDTTHYWDVHHTPADTFDKIDKQALRHNVAVMAVMAYLLAESF